MIVFSLIKHVYKDPNQNPLNFSCAPYHIRILPSTLIAHITVHQQPSTYSQMHLYQKLISPSITRNILKPTNSIPHKLSATRFSLLKHFFSSQSQTDSTKKTFPTFSQLQCKQLITQPNSLRDLIIDQIGRFGEMKLEKYWKLALTDSQFGYYRQQNVFSKEGDFTTSPQISPLFGQMIAVWIAYFLTKTGVFNQINKTVTRKFRLVELGPGRGLLMRDIVKALHEMKIDNHFDISFIEVSQYNRKCQQDNLFEQFKKYDKFFRFEFQNQNKEVQSFKNQNEFQDINLKWFPNLELLVKEDYDLLQAKKQLPLTVFVMNEFFDALPTTILEYTEQGWREKVIGQSIDSQLPLELKNSTRDLHEKFTPQVKDPKIGDRIQVSHQSLIAMDTMAKLLMHTKGAILNIDYGAENTFSNSIRAIKQHKFIPSPYFWQIPGKCDLSAYVNFAALAQFAEANPGIKAFEAIPQGYFLEAMGINPRIEILQKNMNDKEKEKLQSEYHRLIHPEQMGENFKVQCITLKQYGELYPWITQQQGVY